MIHVRELEGEVQELVSKIRDLERTNSSLHNKVRSGSLYVRVSHCSAVWLCVQVAVLKQQCENNGRRRTAYDHVQSRISCVRNMCTCSCMQAYSVPYVALI